MAKIIEENIVIKVSRLVKNPDETDSMVTAEMLQALEQVAQELVGSAAVVEITTV